MSRRVSLTAALLAGLLVSASAARAGTPVDLALVLTVDCSYSVDAREFALQAQGLAQAFLDRSVVEAIAAGPNHAIAVSVVQWSSAASQVLVLPWTVVGDADSAAAVAVRLAAMRRLTHDGATSIASAIDYGVALLEAAPLAAMRRAIDISSDGRNNSGIDVRAARNAAVARGITVNGLAILNEVPTLHYYFEQHVVGGSGAFVVVAGSYDDYVAAIRRKIIREIAGDRLSDAGENAPRPAARRPAAARFAIGGKG